MSVQSFTVTEQEILRKPNDKCGSQENGDINDSQASIVIDDGQEDICSCQSQEYDSTHDSRENNFTCDGRKDGSTDYSQGDDVNDDVKKDSCNKKDETNIFNDQQKTKVFEGGDDLHKIFCEKNPGHIGFVPVNDFNIYHLPDGYQDNDLAEYIKATADLIVRVDVKMTSTERPEFWPNTRDTFPFYNMRGSDVMRLGTGTVVYGGEKPKESKKTCSCQKCQHSDTPSNVWWGLQMITAIHVVFDDIEARHTTCRLFYDRQDSPLVTLDGWKMICADIKADWCLLSCVTCDKDLVHKLRRMEINRDNIWIEVYIKYKSSRDEDKLIFIVSHPHGCPKHISVDHWINRNVLDKHGGTTYTYATSTCPGSSGAHIHSLGRYNGWLYNCHVHSGVNADGNNFSGFGREYL